MNKTDRRANFSLSNILLDMLSIILSYGGAFLLIDPYQNSRYLSWYAGLLASFCIVFFLFMMLFRMYNRSTFFYVDRVMRNTTLSLLGTAATIFLLLFISYTVVFSRLFLAVFVMLSILALNLQKLVILKIKKRAMATDRVIYVGKKKLYENFVRYMEISGYNFDIMGYIDIDDEGVDGLACLGSLNNFEEVLRENPCDHVIFTQSLADRQDLLAYLNIVNEMGLGSKIILDVYKLSAAKWYISSLGTFPMLTYYSVTLDPVLLAMKRVIDLIGAMVGIVLFMPVMLITAILIKLESPGSVIFKQARVGRNGQQFYIYKFRSMYKDAESRLKDLMAQNEMGADGKIFKMKNDPRITKVGKIIRKTSIDELPQFFNVLIGNMSLVGTRPPTVGEVELYDRQHYRRISIKPGITGIWQTSGRNEISDFDKIVQMDIEYIEKWSLWLDVYLILKTVKVLLSKTKGAY